MVVKKLCEMMWFVRKLETVLSCNEYNYFVINFQSFITIQIREFEVKCHVFPLVRYTRDFTFTVCYCTVSLSKCVSS